MLSKLDYGPLISDPLTWKIASGINCLAILSLCLAHAMSQYIALRRQGNKRKRKVRGNS